MTTAITREQAPALDTHNQLNFGSLMRKNCWRMTHHYFAAESIYNELNTHPLCQYFTEKGFMFIAQKSHGEQFSVAFQATRDKKIIGYVIKDNPTAFPKVFDYPDDYSQVHDFGSSPYLEKVLGDSALIDYRVIDFDFVNYDVIENCTEPLFSHPAAVMRIAHLLKVASSLNTAHGYVGF